MLNSNLMGVCRSKVGGGEAGLCMYVRYVPGRENLSFHYIFKGIHDPKKVIVPCTRDKNCVSVNKSGYKRFSLGGKEMTVPLWNCNSKILHPLIALL